MPSIKLLIHRYSPKWQILFPFIKELIHLKQPIGKKLDFYTQELLREATTMSSKALIADIKNESVELKSYIERVKEHAQNVE